MVFRMGYLFFAILFLQTSYSQESEINFQGLIQYELSRDNEIIDTFDLYFGEEKVKLNFNSDHVQDFMGFTYRYNIFSSFLWNTTKNSHSKGHLRKYYE